MMSRDCSLASDLVKAESIRPNRFIGQIVPNTDQLDSFDLLNLMDPLDLDS